MKVLANKTNLSPPPPPPPPPPVGSAALGGVSVVVDSLLNVAYGFFVFGPCIVTALL